jgi:hypothetical protein
MPLPSGDHIQFARISALIAGRDSHSPIDDPGLLSFEIPLKTAFSSRGAVGTDAASASRVSSPGLEVVEGQVWNCFDRVATTRCQRRSRRCRRGCSPHDPGAHSSFSRSKMAPLHASRWSAPSYCRGCVWRFVAGPRLTWRTQTFLPRSQLAECNQQSTCRIRA